MDNRYRLLILIHFSIPIFQFRVWVLMQLKKHRKCISLLRVNIRWMESLDNIRFYPHIALANIKMAQCYLAIGIPSSAVECCYLAADNYTTDKDVEIRKKLICLRLKAFEALADKSPSEKEYWMELAKANVSYIKNSFYKNNIINLWRTKM